MSPIDKDVLEKSRLPTRHEITPAEAVIQAAKDVAAEDSGTIAEGPLREWVTCAAMHRLRAALAAYDLAAGRDA